MTRLTDEELDHLDKFCHLGATSPKAVRKLVDEVKEARRWIFLKQEELKRNSRPLAKRTHENKSRNQEG